MVGTLSSIGMYNVYVKMGVTKIVIFHIIHNTWMKERVLYIDA